VVVVGGGPAGMIAAGMAAKTSNQVILLEKNLKLGKKLYLSGKGRCNITNNTTVENLVENTIVNGKFLKNAFYRFDCSDIIDFFVDLGLKMKTERGNRVFPQSDKSSDVIKVLQKFLNNNNVEVIYENVLEVSKNGCEFHLRTNQSVFCANEVIIATGGRSYPSTGSTGDGYRFARELGHTVTPLKPSLVPINISSNWTVKIGSLKLRNVEIRILKNDKVKYKEFGELEITDRYVTGPIILSASSNLRSVTDHKLILDLKPALSEGQLDKRLVREFDSGNRISISKVLNKIVPLKLKPVILELLEIDPNKRCNNINKIERRKLIYILKNLQLDLRGFRSYDEAIITSGGVCIDEIDPSTMESRIVKGLYFAGEIIDADALTGGFNLQIAWSTGYTAGKSC